MVIKRKKFKIGKFHGKLIPSDFSKEAMYRNILFLLNTIKLNHNRNNSEIIKLIGYEFPTEYKSRSKSIDILGYDKHFSPYIIELKKGCSKEPIEEVVQQILDYKEIFNYIKSEITEDIRETYYWKDFSFSEDIKCIILAPREYYRGKNPKKEQKHLKKKESLYICQFNSKSFTDDKIKKTLLGSLSGFQTVPISILN